jgi:hypothetical protein
MSTSNGGDSAGTGESNDRCFEVHRVDDNGNEFIVATGLTREEAERMADMYEARAHKQMYMVRQARR